MVFLPYAIIYESSRKTALKRFLSIGYIYIDCYLFVTVALVHQISFWYQMLYVGEGEEDQLLAPWKNLMQKIFVVKSGQNKIDYDVGVLLLIFFFSSRFDNHLSMEHDYLLWYFHIKIYFCFVIHYTIPSPSVNDNGLQRMS